jgi:S1-C subfamily serine protease
MQTLKKKVLSSAKAVVKISAFFPSLTSTIAYKGGGRINSSGSGFIIKHNGECYVVTNAHIVVFSRTLTASLIQISTHDEEVFDCSMVGFSSELDIAVLKIHVPEKSKKQFNHLSFKLGSVETGDEVVAIGSPNNLENTMSFGRISNIKREVDYVPYHCYQIENFAAPGSSGSPVIDKSCKVIGMIFAAGHIGGNLSFVIPVKVIDLVVNSIVETGKFLLNKLSVAFTYLPSLSSIFR